VTTDDTDVAVETVGAEMHVAESKLLKALFEFDGARGDETGGHCENIRVSDCSMRREASPLVQNKSKFSENDLLLRVGISRAMPR
jgi:hypothetical protein